MEERLRLVLAEDGDLLRAGILALLAATEAVEVVGAASDLDGLMQLVERTRPDVVLTDVRMPPTFTDEGVRAAAALRQLSPDLGVVVLTQYADVEYALDLVVDGSQGRGYLLKERVADAGELVSALRRVAAGGSVIDETVVRQLLDAGTRRRGSRLERLTGRELEVLGLMAEGASNAGIASRLVVTERAVEKHIGSIFAKLDLPIDTSTHRRVAASLVFLSEAGVSRSTVVPRAW